MDHTICRMEQLHEVTALIQAHAVTSVYMNAFDTFPQIPETKEILRLPHLPASYQFDIVANSRDAGG